MENPFFQYIGAYQQGQFSDKKICDATAGNNFTFFYITSQLTGGGGTPISSIGMNL